MTKLHPKMVLEGGEGRAPSVKLRGVLPERHPELFRINPGPSYATVRVIPRCTDSHMGDCGNHVGPDGWYNVVHTYEILTDEDHWEPGTPTYRRIGKPVAYLPAPVMRSVEERLAELPEIQLTDADIRFFGSAEKAREDREKMQEYAVKHDFSADARDWEATADVFAEILRGVPALKLTAHQRAEQANVRVYWADQEAANSRASRTGLRHNAGLEPIPEDLYGGPGEIVWSVVRGQSPGYWHPQPGEIDLDIPDYALAWAEANGMDHGDSETYLTVTTAEYAHRSIQGEVSRTTIPATGEQMYLINSYFDKNSYRI